MEFSFENCVGTLKSIHYMYAQYIITGHHNFELLLNEIVVKQVLAVYTLSGIVRFCELLSLGPAFQLLYFLDHRAHL